MGWRVRGICPNGHPVMLEMRLVEGLGRLEVFRPEDGCPTCATQKAAVRTNAPSPRAVRRGLKRLERELKRGRL